MSKIEIFNKLWRIEMELSPENLTCDGELSRSQAMIKQRKLLAEQKKLHKELGYAPDFNELYEAYKKGL
jgi:hypothetical protein